MSALYAFCREVDDVSDDASKSVTERRELLEAWRSDVATACSGGVPRFPVVQELQPVIRRHGLPLALFEDLLRGVGMDLEVSRYATFEDLETYCYRVASVVGLLSIEIFGYREAGCKNYAEALGKALQLTNILRDIRNDAERGRIYLPQEVMRRAGVTEDDVLHCRYSVSFRQVAEVVAARARGHFRRAREQLPGVDRRSMAAAELMGAVYWRLLRKMERNEFDVFGPQLTRVSKAEKVLLILRTWFRIWAGSSAPNYGTT